MKIAVLSDIHGNVPALEAVLGDIDQWAPDTVIVNGDLVSRGPYSLECLRMLQGRGDVRFLTGNHETFVLHCVDTPPDPTDTTAELRRIGDWTCAQLGEAVEEIRSWRPHLDLTLPGGRTLHVTHGSRLGDRDGIHPETEREALVEKLGEPRDLFVASHTHRPLIRSFGQTLVVNTGSVGQPFDGDPRACYGRFCLSNDRWEGDIARVAYDRAQAERDFVESGFLSEAGPMARMIHRELRECRAHIAPWRRRYMGAVKAGEISVHAAVEAYLRGLG